MLSQDHASADIAVFDDLIWGAKDIALEIKQSHRQTLWLIEKKLIPTSRIGGRVVASRARLRAHFAALLSADA